MPNPWLVLARREGQCKEENSEAILRKEHGIKIIVEANETLLPGQRDAAIIKTSPENNPKIQKEDKVRSPVNSMDMSKSQETRRLVITGRKD
jgi:hypothetical protein